MGKSSALGRQIAATIGILSVLLMSAFLPWRTASCFALDAVGEPAPQIICRADAASGHSRLVTSPDAPKHPDCAICLGLAGLALAVVAVALLDLVLGRLSHVLHIPRALCLHGVEGLLRFSRAPPLAA